MTPRRAFRSLAWGFHAPGGIVLWWIIQASRHLHVLDEMPFEQLDEPSLAAAIRTRDKALGIGRDADGGLLSLEIPAIAYTVGTPEIVSNPKEKRRGIKGETIGDRLLKYGVVVIAGDDDRLNGWQRCQSFLQLSLDGKPALTVDPRCKQLIHAIPTGLQDAKHSDDVRDPSPSLTAFRFGAMSRPTPLAYTPVVKIPAGSPADVMRSIRQRQEGNRVFGEAR